MKEEFKFSVLLKYQRNERILSNVNLADLKSCMIPCLEKIVFPFEQGLKSLMKQHNLIHEAELFCSDFGFRHSLSSSALSVQNQAYLQQDTSQRSDHLVIKLTRQLNHLVSKFRQLFLTLQRSSPALAPALYVCAYFHPSNKDFSLLLDQVMGDAASTFTDLWCQLNQHSHHLQYQAGISNYNTYVLHTSLAEEGN